MAETYVCMRILIHVLRRENKPNHNAWTVSHNVINLILLVNWFKVLVRFSSMVLRRHGLGDVKSTFLPECFYALHLGSGTSARRLKAFSPLARLDSLVVLRREPVVESVADLQTVSLGLVAVPSRSLALEDRIDIGVARDRKPTVHLVFGEKTKRITYSSHGLEKLRWDCFKSDKVESWQKKFFL